ncbi:MAG: shikimate kinase AroK [Methylococcaceae bacterium]|jgi:shikimate kinase|nr:shikimate kinase AroK [Methylococcaceae bacterium]MDD1608801.1 shikimate kinase AroK [Methylococcaceae bacterium]MDD1610036.1 shikimate kinase AroK [Methylococcaceae bacterium]MDD1615941.1 shikimate kinase AroK [Methylococcaceae bacterium]OYV19024.1 MAG: Shikimate kinase [Methylococcaceae bacterium NSP1-2]
MSRFENIYLVGLMGAGKTTIGRQLARTLKLPFYDSDKAIEESTGVDIPTIFEFEGEEGFRDREQKMLQQLTKMDGIVLATGGGAVLREENRQLLKENGFIVYLQCSVDRILERTRRDTQRPLLNTDNPRERIETLFAQREPLYLSCADYKIDTGVLQSKVVVNHILEEYKSVHR